ncbi:TonB-dependent receptor [Gemmatimonadetes bacterium T265]|nr:TonB-dependent receptor [Gemmatimonadetes bacterium T265]
MPRRPFALCLAAPLVCAVAVHPLRAQPAARLAGVVRDAGGAVLAGARVTARNEATGAVRSATTSGAGAYAVSGLAPGSYTVTATLIGHRVLARRGVRVPAADNVDFVLEPVSLQQVVVTATLREQSLRDVPISVAAPTARELRERGATTLEDVAANVAGFSVQNLGPGQSQPAIRGASSGQIARDQPGVKEDVGVYLDDVPVSLSLFTPDLDLFDVSRVEVLRGPQGTLFGAGSFSGTVRYISAQPELGLLSTFGEASGSGTANGNAGGAFKLGANVPLGDQAAGRVAAYYTRTPGYITALHPDGSTSDAVNQGYRAGGRLALRVDPVARLSIVPRLVYQDVKSDGFNRIDAFNILANPYTTTRPATTLGSREQYTQVGESFSDRFTLGDVRATYDLGPARLTSVTAYTHRNILVGRDGGALASSILGGSLGLPAPIYTLAAPFDDRTKLDVLTQELRLGGGSGNGGAGTFRWVVGGYYANNRRAYGQQVNINGFTEATGIPTKGLLATNDQIYASTLSYHLRQSAAFGEATVTVAPRLDLTGGLRYYHFDEHRVQAFDGILTNDSTGKSLVFNPGTTKANGFAPRVIASYRATDDLTLNAQASKGFRLGGINDPLNTPLCTAADLTTFGGRGSFGDQTAWNYEVGAKSRLAGGKASFDVAAYTMDITDLQLTVTAGTCSSRLVFNAPKARSQGLEAEFSASPTPSVDLSLSGALNNARLRSTLTSTDANGVVSVVSGIQSGTRLPSVPKAQAAASATLRRPLGGAFDRALGAGADGFVTGAYTYVGSRYTQIGDLAPGVGTVNIASFGKNTIGGPLTQSTFTFDPLLPAYSLLNLRAGVQRSGVEVAVFANNVTDTRALLSLDRERGLLARVGYLTNQPRTIGVSATFRR